MGRGGGGGGRFGEDSAGRQHDGGMYRNVVAAVLSQQAALNPTSGTLPQQAATGDALAAPAS